MMSCFNVFLQELPNSGTPFLSFQKTIPILQGIRKWEYGNKGPTSKDESLEFPLISDTYTYGSLQVE